MQTDPTVVIGKKYVTKVKPFIESAKRSIDIVVYEWRLKPTLPTHPVSVFMRSLQDAATRGVRVRAIVGNEFLAKQLGGYGILARVHHGDKILHAKMLLIDGVVAVVGSHNFTEGGFVSNLEISLVSAFALEENELSAYFSNLWGL